MSQLQCLKFELTLSIVAVSEFEVVASLGHWRVREGVVHTSVPQSIGVRFGSEWCNDVDGVVRADSDLDVPVAVNCAGNDCGGGTSCESDNGGGGETHDGVMESKG
jgi:hypothetical protein